MASVTNDVGCGMKIVVEASSNDPETERRVVRDEMYRHDCKVLETFLDKFNLPRMKSIRKDFKVGLQTHDPNFANPSWCHSSHALTAYSGGLLVVSGGEADQVILGVVDGAHGADSRLARRGLQSAVEELTVLLETVLHRHHAASLGITTH